MPFDGITTSCIVKELNTALQGGRIKKIQQPENDEIRLQINNNKENYTLLLSASPNNARAHLSALKKENPKVPPVFCMTLRKYITGARIKQIEQQENDRIIEIVLDSRDEFGEPLERRLIAEITGRNANLILTAEEEGEKKITDALKRVGFTSSRYRQILPGEIYKEPPGEDRHNPFKVTREEVLGMMVSHEDLDPEKFFYSVFYGLSPSFAREVLYRAQVEGGTKLRTYSAEQMEAIADAFLAMIEELKNEEGKPRLYLSGGDLLDFYPLQLNHLGAQEKDFETYSEMLEDFYTGRDQRMRFKTKSADLRHKLENLRKRAAKKLQMFAQDEKKLQNNEKNRIYGDLITANIYQIERGMKEAELINYEDPDFPTVKVPLKVNETPSQNAQRFYKKYQKGKRAMKELEVQKAQTEEQLYYIDSLLESLRSSTLNSELDEIAHEFRHSDLVSKKGSQGGGKGDKRPKASEPMRFTSSEGFTIYVGKNNYQNDYISTRLGVDEDCWLHVKDAPGSHVLIVADGRFITEKTVLEGGMLAAWYSSQRQSENVPVDYLEFRDLKKPKKAKPGMVVFTTHDTMYVTPDRAEVARIEGLDEPL